MGEQRGSANDERSCVEPFPDLSIDDEERERLIVQLQTEENELSYARRMLHGRIDMLRAERTARLKQKPDTELAQLGDDRMHEALEGVMPMSIAAAKVGDEFPDLATLSDAELDQTIAQLEAEENELSYRRRLLHGRIDILRAGVKGVDLARLTEILSGKAAPPDG